MTMVRRITVGFRLSDRSAKLEKHDVIVPAAAIPDDVTDPLRVLELPDVRRRFVALTAPVFVDVSDPYDDSPVGFHFG